MTNKINSIDVSECKYKFQDKDKFDGKEYCTLHNELCENISFVCDKNCQVYEDYKQLKRLQEENEKIKKQYNCYACGNCNGKEDYINLKKHHKGLRKQFDELAKRNNTLSLRIEELEEENEELKAENEQLKKPCLVIPKVNQLAVPIEKYEKLYKALEEIREKLKKYDANIGDTIIANPIQDCYDTYKLINEVLK